jgi:hypothetical protein
VSHGNPTSSPTEPSDPRWWKWGELIESAWRDARKILESGDWLGAAGMFGTALFLGRVIYANADVAARAKTDAVLAAGKQERAMAFIEMIAGAVGTHFEHTYRGLRPGRCSLPRAGRAAALAVPARRVGRWCRSTTSCTPSKAPRRDDRYIRSTAKT